MTDINFRNTEDCIKRIKSIKEMYAKDTPSEIALNEAIKSLEKQIAKKVENKKYLFHKNSTLLKHKYGECPICKSMQEDDEYCANCGQKLDWSDKE